MNVPGTHPERSPFKRSFVVYFLLYSAITNQIKSNQSSFMWWKKVPRLSQTHRWFTEYYSVDSVTATDMRNLNKEEDNYRTGSNFCAIICQYVFIW